MIDPNSIIERNNYTNNICVIEKQNQIKKKFVKIEGQFGKSNAGDM